MIDTLTNTVTATVAVGDHPETVAIAPDGARAYVTNSFSDNVSVIDTATNTVVTTVAVGDGPFGVAITPDGAHVYVTNALSSTVSVIDTATNTVTGTVAAGDNPFGVAIVPSSRPTLAIASLIDAVSALPGVHAGTTQSLVTKLNSARAGLNAGDIATACRDLGAFLNATAAQAGKKLTAADADALMAVATSIRAALGCS